MESHRTSKMYKKGFTIIEMALVLALVSLIAGASVMFSLPAISQFACAQEGGVLVLALERSRHISQFGKRGDIQLEITEAGYDILGEDENKQSILFDRLDHQSAVSVSASRDIIFKENSGAVYVADESDPAIDSEIHIVVGGNADGCERVTTINHAGTIL